MAGISTERLVNREAQQHLQRKVNALRFAWQDTEAYEHAVAFTVAKMMDADLLAETRAAVQDALDTGTDFAAFKKRLKPYLMARGWWGQALMGDPDSGEIKKVQLGSTRRLRTIYHTNLHTAYAAGQWERIQENKASQPYLKYIGSDAAEPREAHKQFYGKILPVDDPFWQTHMPPNGWGCRCNVRALTKAQAEREGISESPRLTTVEVINKRTGEITTHPGGVDPSFAHNHGDRLGALLKIAENKHGTEFAIALADEIAVLTGRKSLPPPEKWKEVAAIGKQIWEKHADLLDSADLNAEGAFAQALLQMLEREGVRTGAQVLAKGDQAKKFAHIITRFPAEWVEKANAMGTVYIRSLDTRGYHWHVAEEHVDWANKHISRNQELKIFSKFAGQFQAGDSLLKLNNMDGKTVSAKAQDISIHEYAHRLQRVMPELDEYFKQLWLDRTRDEKTRPLADFAVDKKSSHYDRKEVGREDNFANGYIGRNYGDDENPQPKEVMTMTFQTLLGSGRDNIITLRNFLERDPEMLHLGIGLLTRFKP